MRVRSLRRLRCLAEADPCGRPLPPALRLTNEATHKEAVSESSMLPVGQPRLRTGWHVLRDEVAGDVGHLAPAVIDGQRMPATRNPMDLRETRVLLLLLVGSMGNRPRDGVVVLARDDQQRHGPHRVQFPRPCGDGQRSDDDDGVHVDVGTAVVVGAQRHLTGREDLLVEDESVRAAGLAIGDGQSAVRPGGVEPGWFGVAGVERHIDSGLLADGEGHGRRASEFLGPHRRAKSRARQVARLE